MDNRRKQAKQMSKG